MSSNRNKNEIFINHKAAVGLKKNFLKAATFKKINKSTNKSSTTTTTTNNGSQAQYHFLYSKPSQPVPPPPVQKYGVGGGIQNPLQFKQHQPPPSNQNKIFFDLNDDSAIGMSEKQPLIDNDCYDTDDFNQNDNKFYQPLSYDSNFSDFGSSADSQQQDQRQGRKYRLIDPHQMKKKMLMEKEKRTTNLQTMMHILKGNIGTGILAMPNAFMNAGLFVGLGVLPLLCILCTHCMHILVRANHILSRRLGTGMLEYQEVASNALLIGPRSLRSYSRLASRLVNVFLLITQFGFCCVYSLFVAENVSQFVGELTPDQFHFTPLAYLGFLLPLFILLSFVRSLRHLSLASSMANLLQTLGLMIVMFNLVQDLPNTNSVEAVGNLGQFPLFLGTAIYAFEGIGLVLPLQKEMQEPESLGGYVGVLNASMTIVACLNIAIGFFGYLKFGDAVSGSITLNLPPEPLYQSCKMIFATAIFLSYAIQYYVPFNIIWPWFRQKMEWKEGTKKTTMYEYFFRSFLVVFTVALAAAVPKLDLFISLVGALSSSGLALIFPPLIDICVLWEEEHGFWRWTWIYGKNFTIFLLGIAGLTTGTFASITNILANLNEPTPP